MKVIFSSATQVDLFHIGDWIAQDNPVRAHSFVDELIEACQRLGEMPHRFQLIRRHPEFGLRRRPYGNYSIFYTVGVNEVEIVRILHGARDWERLLFPDEDE